MTPADAPRCPECGSTFTIDEKAGVEYEVANPLHVLGTPIETRVRTAVVAFCDGCEFSIEVSR